MMRMVKLSSIKKSKKVVQHKIYLKLKIKKNQRSRRNKSLKKNKNQRMGRKKKQIM